MPKSITEDAVRDMARDILGFVDNDLARSGVGQLKRHGLSDLHKCHPVIIVQSINS